MWKHLNMNPYGRNVGDCTVRAISKALNQTWRETYMGLCAEGLKLCDMPSSNAVWGSYLREKGYQRDIVPDDYTTVSEFAVEHPRGTYILALSGHVVCLRNGLYFDSWDSGNEFVIYYWSKEE